MANIKSLSDLNGDDGDDKQGKFNDYYAGGEKRWGCSRVAGRCSEAAFAHTSDPHAVVLLPALAAASCSGVHLR